MMKFLLPQKIKKRKVEDGKIRVLAGNAGFIRHARQHIIQENKAYRGKYLITESYDMLSDDYKKVLGEFKRMIEEKRKKFYTCSLLEQLILLLKYIFIRNKQAKLVEKYSAEVNAYNDKAQFLEMALNIAKNIETPNFQFGYQVDPDSTFHQIIYYFQIDEKQVSFHSEQLYPGVPEFNGAWIGHRNESFPFNLREIKRLIK